MGESADWFVRIEGIDVPTFRTLRKGRDPLADAVIGYEPARHPVLGRFGWKTVRLIQRLSLRLDDWAYAIDKRSYRWTERAPVYDQEKLKAIPRTMEWGFAEFPGFTHTEDVADTQDD